MARFEKVPADAFKQMTYGAGIIASNFSPETGEVKAEDILYMTQGGNVFSATRDIEDVGANYDNLPEGVMQLQKPKRYQAEIRGTAVTVTAERLKEMLASADIDGETVQRIAPRDYFEMSDFKDIWLICNYSEDNSEETGGYVAYHLKNALNTAGLEATHEKDTAGKFPYVFRAFYDIDNLDETPFEVYIKAGTAA